MCHKTEIFLQKNKIVKIINCAKGCENLTNVDIEYLNLDILDEHTVNITECFETSNKFIDECINKKQSVLVHCNAGQSRSVSIIIAYLMQYKKMNLLESFKLIKDKKPNIGPNIGFFEKVKKYEEKIFGDVSFSTHEYAKMYIEEMFPNISKNKIHNLLDQLNYDLSLTINKLIEII